MVTAVKIKNMYGNKYRNEVMHCLINYGLILLGFGLVPKWPPGASYAIPYAQGLLF